ncbi:peroxidase family protein [Bacterioplanoides pacificum]|uniref:Peroxidase family protein n=1 Tax=Bacterioplanoides pacificum TaxID=1171596 RepID=A0ABV7VXS0_9GAMM
MTTSVWVTWPTLAKLGGSLGVAAGLLILAFERQELQENNLIATEDLTAVNATIVCDERSLGARTEDGTCNILDNPAEGSVNRRFGRNVQLEAAYGETENDTLLEPNPREVSNVLMARDEFKPATSVNFIAAAWIQFMVHDWIDHGDGDAGNPILVPRPANDPQGPGVMSIKRTIADTDRSAEDDATLPPTYRNINTHWWDGSQLYGSDKATNTQVRAFVDGKLAIEEDGTLPTEYWSGVPVTGFNKNWWLGLSMLHQLFTLEHNAIADMLKQNNPGRSDQWLYDKARLINAALMAKIHTIEWTPAIIANPVTERAMRANWYGLTDERESRDEVQKILDGLSSGLTDSPLLKTLLASRPDLIERLDDPNFIDFALGGLVGTREAYNSGTDYTLTEEFTAVYRLHPLLRDDVEVYDIGSSEVARRIPMMDTREGQAEDILDEEGGDRLWYSFGTTYPGALTLHNYPEFLRNLSIPFSDDLDLATIDILRDRERGVPRYNEFRRQIGLNPITKFEDLTSDPTTLAELKRLYDNDIEKIDTLVGQLAETVRPEGFAFGETAFQIFILNASRRLMTDRFFTSDYRAEIYTQEGIDWVENNDMKHVLERHFPELKVSLTGIENAFKPWGLKIPDNYQQMAACDKQTLLWQNGVVQTEYAAGERPALQPVDIGGLIDSVLWKKVRRNSDVAPLGYEKPIHPYGAMATVAFEATNNHPYTGVFKGAECGLVRLSVTGDPADRGFAPGLAWKTFIDGQESRNVSALYTLSGQGDNHNFFANELSQYVSAEANDTLGSTILFSLVSSKPTRLMTENLATARANGSAEAAPKAPTQIYFVPTADVSNRFSSNAHDFRDDLTTLKSGTALYDVYATDQRIRTSIFSRLTKRYARDRRNSAVKVGTLRLTSDMTTSAFGDGGVFFKHQRYEDR